MNTASLIQNIEYKADKPAISVLLETEFSKEIRIVFRKGQIMKEHKTAYPITVEIFEGEISFGVNGVVHDLKKGDIIALDGYIAHDLVAIVDSIVRLSLAKQDKVERVEQVVE